MNFLPSSHRDPFHYISSLSHPKCYDTYTVKLIDPFNNFKNGIAAHTVGTDVEKMKFILLPNNHSIHNDYTAFISAITKLHRSAPQYSNLTVFMLVDEHNHLSMTQRR